MARMWYHCSIKTRKFNIQRNESLHDDTQNQYLHRCISVSNLSCILILLPPTFHPRCCRAGRLVGIVFFHMVDAYELTDIDMYMYATVCAQLGFRESLQFLQNGQATDGTCTIMCHLEQANRENPAEMLKISGRTTPQKSNIPKMAIFPRSPPPNHHFGYPFLPTKTNSQMRSHIDGQFVDTFQFTCVPAWLKSGVYENNCYTPFPK